MHLPLDGNSPLPLLTWLHRRACLSLWVELCGLSGSPSQAQGEVGCLTQALRSVLHLLRPVASIAGDAARWEFSLYICACSWNGFGHFPLSFTGGQMLPTCVPLSSCFPLGASAFLSKCSMKKLNDIYEHSPRGSSYS